MRHLSRPLLSALAASLLISACGSSSNTTASNPTASNTTSTPAAAQAAGSAQGAVVKTAANSNLGTILTDSKGLTLYHLSGEQNGKFICTSSACLGVWHPLIAPAGGAPKGAVGSLGTVKRPDGTTQVTFQGTPLYTFAQDQGPGETNGQGIKDVGTWTVATSSAGATPSSTGGATSTTSTTETSSGGGYRY